MKLDVDQEIENRLRDQAGKRGLTAERYALLLLDAMVRTAPDFSDRRTPFQVSATDEEWETGIDDLLDRREPQAPPLPDEALRRESLYEDRD